MGKLRGLAPELTLAFRAGAFGAHSQSSAARIFKDVPDAEAKVRGSLAIEPTNLASKTAAMISRRSNGKLAFTSLTIRS